MNKQMKKRQDKADELKQKLEDAYSRLHSGDESAKSDVDEIENDLFDLSHSFVGRYRHMLKNEKGRGVTKN